MYTRFRISHNTFNAICCLCGDTPPDPTRKLLALSVSPLVRTLFEDLISLIFILEDIPKNIPYFLKTGYTELRRERKYCETYHSQKLEWKQYIADLDTQIAEREIALNLTQDEIKTPYKHIGMWPTPGQILQKMQKVNPPSPNISFIEYVNSWMYRTLSGDSHSNVPGTINRGIYFAKKELRKEFGEGSEQWADDKLQEYRTEMVWNALVILLAIVTELNLRFDFRLNDKLKYLWTIYREYSDTAKEFYDDRYKSLL